MSCMLMLLTQSCQEPKPARGSKPPLAKNPDTLIVLSDSLPNAEFAYNQSTTDNADRENWQKPRLVITKLGDLSDRIVADIGAGTGYFTFKIAEKARKVVAVDIDERFLRFIEQKSRKAVNSGLLNIETRLTRPDDPNLKAEEVDVAILVNTYTYISERVEYFSKVKSGLKPNGMLVIVDFKKEDMQFGPAVEEKLSPEEVISELEMSGFTQFEIDEESLDYQYMIFAR